MLNILVWFTRRSSEAQLSVDRDSLRRLQATPSTSVHCNNRRLPDNSKPSAISANPGNLSRRGKILDLSYLQIIVAFFRSSPNLTDQEVSSQWKRITTNKSSSQQQKNHLYPDHRLVNKAKYSILINAQMCFSLRWWFLWSVHRIDKETPKETEEASALFRGIVASWPRWPQEAQTPGSPSARLLSDQGPRDSGLRLQASRGLWIQSQWKMVRREGHWPPPASCTQHQAPPSQPGLRLTLLLKLIFPK